MTASRNPSASTLHRQPAWRTFGKALVCAVLLTTLALVARSLAPGMAAWQVRA